MDMPKNPCINALYRLTQGLFTSFLFIRFDGKNIMEAGKEDEDISDNERDDCKTTSLFGKEIIFFQNVPINVHSELASILNPTNELNDKKGTLAMLKDRYHKGPYSQSEEQQELAWIWPNFEKIKHANQCQSTSLQSYISAHFLDGHCRYASASTYNTTFHDQASLHPTNLDSEEHGSNTYVHYEHLNLSIFYTQSNFSIDNSIISFAASQNITYIPQHASLAPLHSIYPTSTEIVSMYNISPISHTCLHVFIRSNQFQNTPLLPSQNSQKRSDLDNSARKTPKKKFKLRFRLFPSRRAKKTKLKPLQSSSSRNLTWDNHLQDDIDSKVRFLLLQLFHAVSFCHEQGMALIQNGMLHPKRIFISNEGWLHITFPIKYMYSKDFFTSNSKHHIKNNANENEDLSIDPKHKSSTSKFKFSIPSYPGSKESPTRKWRNGTLSNLAYLLLLNESAGRIPEDPSNPPILPWITDFSQQILDPNDMHAALGTGGWRDLSKSKYRLTKGDIQLDNSFKYATPSHHLQEALSDISYAVYKARCTPMHVLQSKVRPQFVPEHYPESIYKLFHWTPDECILEFYSTSYSNVFTSEHSHLGLKDLVLPGWCSSNSEFIEYHRKLLESDEVSRWLHLWIDLNFGDALVGNRAIKEKNVPLKVQCRRRKRDTSEEFLMENSQIVNCAKAKDDEVLLSESCYTFIQLFPKAHPRRKRNIDGGLLHFSIPIKTKEMVSDEKCVESGNPLCPESPLITDSKLSNHDIHNQKYIFNTSRLSKQYRINDFIKMNQGHQNAIDYFELDTILVGMIIEEIYNIVDIHPPPEIVAAFHGLQKGNLNLQDIIQETDTLKEKHVSDLEALPSNVDNKEVSPLFPKYLHNTYNVLAEFQYTNGSNVTQKEQKYLLATEGGVESLSHFQIRYILKTLSNIELLKRVSPKGLGFILPTIKTSLFSIVTCFQNEQITNGNVDSIHELTKILYKFVDVFGGFLGKEATDESLLLYIIHILDDAIESMTYAGIEFLRSILLTPILCSLYYNSNLETFVRLVFPFLIKLLVLDASKFDWDLTDLKKSASVSLSFLAQEESLQPLFDRIIVPAILHNIADSESYYEDVFIGLKGCKEVPNESKDMMGENYTIFKSFVTQSLEGKWSIGIMVLRSISSSTHDV